MTLHDPIYDVCKGYKEGVIYEIDRDVYVEKKIIEKFCSDCINYDLSIVSIELFNRGENYVQPITEFEYVIPRDITLNYENWNEYKKKSLEAMVEFLKIVPEDKGSHYVVYTWTQEEWLEYKKTYLEN